VEHDGLEQRSDTSKLTIDLCNQEKFDSLEVDETVELRASEVRAATLQENAQVAARAGNWSEVDKIMIELVELGKDNEWVKATAASLRRYSLDRHAEAFSKESLYKSRRMKQRYVAREEARFVMESRSMPSQPSYLRRKIEEGKREL
jgi:Ca-activated chloride channel family protein